MGVAWLVPVAHGTEEGMEPDDLLCSRNARPQKALVGRAQWETNWTALHMRSVQAWRAHHQQPWQPVRKIWVIRLSGDRSPQAPSLIKA